MSRSRAEWTVPIVVVAALVGVALFINWPRTYRYRGPLELWVRHEDGHVLEIALSADGDPICVAGILAVSPSYMVIAETRRQPGWGAAHVTFEDEVGYVKRDVRLSKSGRPWTHFVRDDGPGAAERIREALEAQN